MVLNFKILCGVLVVVVIVCLLQKSTFSQTQPSSESFGKIALDVFFMPESEAAPAPKNTTYTTEFFNCTSRTNNQLHRNRRIME